MAHNHIHIDPALPFFRQADKGHNRWHPDIAPAIRIASGSSVEMETLDALDGQIRPSHVGGGSRQMSRWVASIR